MTKRRMIRILFVLWLMIPAHSVFAADDAELCEIGLHSHSKILGSSRSSSEDSLTVARLFIKDGYGDVLKLFK